MNAIARAPRAGFVVGLVAFAGCASGRIPAGAVDPRGRQITAWEIREEMRNVHQTGYGLGFGLAGTVLVASSVA